MKRFFTLIILFGAVLLAGCNDKTPVPDPVDPDPKTFIMFGKISGFSGDVEEAENVVASGILKGGQRLLVYNDSGRVLYELVRDKKQSTGFRKIELQTYDRTVSSMNPERMGQILRDAMEAAPANHYALSVGVHGSGWVPAGSGMTQARLRDKSQTGPAYFENTLDPLFEPLFERHGPALTRALNGELNNADFAAVIDGLDEQFDFVIIDACFMTSVESLYDMRSIAPYIIASPTEILMDGFPFDRILKRLFNDWTDLEGVCGDFVNYYASTGSPYATIALVKTSEIEPLMRTVRDIRLDGYNGNIDPVTAGFQYYENMAPHLFYDLGQYIEAWAANTSLYSLFKQQLDKTVIYKRHTDKFYSDYGYDPETGASGCAIRIDPNHFSGLNVYVPQPAKYPKFYVKYQQTAWYKAVYE